MIGQSLEATPLPKAHFTIPDDEPINVMTPTPHRLRRKKVSKTPARAFLKNQLALLASEECSHFGFNLKAPPPPAFVGSETLDVFQHRQTTSKDKTMAKIKCPDGERVASVLVSHLNQHASPGPQHNRNSGQANSGIPAHRNSAQTVSSPLLSPHSKDGPPSHNSPDHDEKSQSRKSDSDLEEEFHCCCHIAKAIVPSQLEADDDYNEGHGPLYDNDNNRSLYEDYDSGDQMGTSTVQTKELSHHLGDERAGVAYDLIKHHYTTNCCRHSPSLEYLESVHNQEDYRSLKRRRQMDAMDVNEGTQVVGGDEEVDIDHRNEERSEGEQEEQDEEEGNVDSTKKKGGRYSKNLKGSIPSKTTNISFYPQLWRKLLNLAKAHIECKEVLHKAIAYFEENQWQVDRDYMPNMCRLIFNDTQTFHSDIKKVVMKFIHPGYDLFLPATAGIDKEKLTVVKNKADKLLSTSSYLHGAPDAQVFQLYIEIAML
ncbi:hypothetical protein EV363DRAFT_1295397 [Boletus edulis]|nr:hypothetical protein EV363DRAFT_1295397 [Boletus edulis]